jgi:HPt (histidine-containing phosphotransfer) domain-containing protein
MDDFLSKPFQRNELAQRLMKHVRANAIQPSEIRIASASDGPARPEPPPPPLASFGPPAPARPPTVAPRASAAPAQMPRFPEQAPQARPAGPSVLDRSALDRIRAIQRADRPDLATKVLTLYLERSPAQIQAIVEAADDATRLARAAHDLKGGSGNLGLFQIAELLARIEQLAKRGELQAVPELLAELPGVHAAAIAAVRVELDRPPNHHEAHHA